MRGNTQGWEGKEMGADCGLADRSVGKVIHHVLRADPINVEELGFVKDRVRLCHGCLG